MILEYFSSILSFLVYSLFFVILIGHFAIVCLHIYTHTHIYIVGDSRFGHFFQQQLSEREREREGEEEEEGEVQ